MAPLRSDPNVARKLIHPATTLRVRPREAALTNAVFALHGTRVRALPVAKSVRVA
jgi:hypothetical protein